MNEMTILRLDNFGRGICYINDKITFVKNALPDEIVNIKITKETKKYNEAEVTKYIKTSNKRVKEPCPLFNICGGCNLEHLSYDDTISFKEDKLNHIFKKYYNQNIEVIKSDKSYNYRNKITLKVINGKIGYFEEESHKLVEIKDCLLAKESIRNIFANLKDFHVKNGEIIIRSNYNDELLIWIKTKDQITPDLENLNNKKIVGIIVNDKTIYGESNFVEIINNKYYKVSYDSFFQINPFICSKIFDLLNDYLTEDEIILDLYCGVGTLGIAVGNHVNKVYGIEIIPNAILNAISNSKVNNLKNAYYLLGKSEEKIDKINDKISTIIVDPPRSGLDKHTLNTILNFKPNKIIYVSCDPMTLSRDLQTLTKDYNIVLLKGFDMFPNTAHCESIAVLERK